MTKGICHISGVSYISTLHYIHHIFLAYPFSGYSTSKRVHSGKNQGLLESFPAGNDVSSNTFERALGFLGINSSRY